MDDFQELKEKIKSKSLSSALQEYSDELNSDVYISNNNIREKAMMAATIRSKWLMKLYGEKENLTRLKDIKTKYIQKTAGNTASNNPLLAKIKQDNLLDNNENLKKIQLLIQQTQTNIEFIEHALVILNDFVWQIKNIVEILKLEIK